MHLCVRAGFVHLENHVLEGVTLNSPCRLTVGLFGARLPPIVCALVELQRLSGEHVQQQQQQKTLGHERTRFYQWQAPSFARGLAFHPCGDVYPAIIYSPGYPRSSRLPHIAR